MRGHDYGSTSSNGHSQQFTMGLLCGAAVGAAIGMLLAPKSGSELRSDLSGAANKLRKTVDNGYQQAQGMVDQVVEEGREAVRRGREAFDRTRSEFEESREERQSDI